MVMLGTGKPMCFLCWYWPPWELFWRAVKYYKMYKIQKHSYSITNKEDKTCYKWDGHRFLFTI